MNKTRKRQLLSVTEYILGVRPHRGMWTRWGYAPNRQRQLKKAFRRARRAGAPARLAMTKAALEVGRYA